MDDTEVLFRARNSFYLGNYTQVIEIWKEAVSANTTFGDATGSDLYTIMHRTLLFFLVNNQAVNISTGLQIIKSIGTWRESGIFREVQANDGHVRPIFEPSQIFAVPRGR